MYAFRVRGKYDNDARNHANWAYRWRAGAGKAHAPALRQPGGSQTAAKRQPSGSHSAPEPA